jgi:hypothetical protein
MSESARSETAVDPGEPTRPPQRLWPMPLGLRTVLMVGAPALFAAYTVLHPQPDMSTAGLVEASTWFMTYHLVQLPLIGLVGLSVLVLADQYGHAGAWTVRLGIGTFLVFFSAYDTLAGMGTGLAMQGARDLPPDQQDAVFEIVESWPMFEPVAFLLSIVGTLGWVVAVGSLAWAARRRGAPRTVWVFIALAAIVLMVGHPAPFGTVAFGSLAVAAAVTARRGAGFWSMPTPEPGSDLHAATRSRAPWRDRPEGG